MVFERTPRILLAKPGQGEHDKCAKVVAYALKEAGFEIIFTGVNQSVEMIVEAAIQEDVDVIGLTIMSGEHLQTCRKLMDLLNRKEARDIMVLVGGDIPPQDIPILMEEGIKAVFPGGTDIEAPAAFIREHMHRKAESTADQANRGNL